MLFAARRPVSCASSLECSYLHGKTGEAKQKLTKFRNQFFLELVWAHRPEPRKENDLGFGTAFKAFHNLA